MELECVAQNYAWGRPGRESRVAKLLKSACPEVEIDEKLGYAELWMGTHKNGPSKIKETGEDLGDYLRQNPQLLGNNITSKFGNELCFLFKILSVDKALSIQAHPNKTHAEQLHAASPTVYKDPNHKPEMCLALTPFQALYGFRPACEIVSFFQDMPELRSLIGEELCAAFVTSQNEQTLKACFSSLMRASQQKVVNAADELLTRIIATAEKSQTDELFSRLCNQFPNDRGCFSIYLLNYVTLNSGEALFLGPNVIHAYLFGDCVECMACSDNVVRAGLTPKFQDVDTLVEMLQYEMLPTDKNRFEGKPVEKYVTLFNPPVPDFAVESIRMDKEETAVLPQYDSASILVVISGCVDNFEVSPANSNGKPGPKTLITGTVLFLEANQKLTLVNSQAPFIGFRALCV